MAWGKVGPKWWARMEVKWKTMENANARIRILESSLTKIFLEFSFPYFSLKTLGSLL